MSDIARARRLLDVIRQDLKTSGLRGQAKRLGQAIALMHREPCPKKRAPVDRKSRKMTPKLAKEIRAFVKANPNVTQFKVALIFNVRRQGSISDAIHEKI